MAAVAAEPTVEQGQRPQPPNPPFMLFFVLEDIFNACSTRGEEMNPRLWRILPIDVLEKILVLLPARSQARFRTVCKAWLNLLTSEPFLTLTAALAFSREHSICAVSSRKEDHASARDLKRSRCKQHKVSLEWLPTEFRKYVNGGRIRCQEGLILTSSYEFARFPQYLSCVLNPANQTFKVLPQQLDYDCWEPVSAYSVEVSGEGKWRIRVYADGVCDNYDEGQFGGIPYGAAYDSETHAWQAVLMPKLGPPERGRYLGMVMDLIYFCNGWDEIDIHMFSSQNESLVRKLPPWTYTEMMPKMSLCVMDDEVVALAFSTSKQNLCEVRQVNVSDTEWVLVSTMPYEVLWPRDERFYWLQRVELVGNVALTCFCILGMITTSGYGRLRLWGTKGRVLGR